VLLLIQQLGGGCELAMLCDILLCSPDAKFAQPEITLGIIPGAGGTQRLTHLIGKARAMDMVLTGRRISAKEAGEWGLVSRVTKDGESVVDEAVKVAEQISGFGRVAVQAGKEAVNGGES
jgi:enoyl-CoA hydratase